VAVLTIGGVGIGGDNPCRFVAEIGANHNGSYDTALRLIDAAKASGAEFVKFQAYTLDEILGLRGDGPAPEPWARYGTLRQLYEKAITPLEWLPDLFQYARDIGIVPFASVFGIESLAALEKVKCPAYKVARHDNHKASVTDPVYQTGKPMIVSATTEEVTWPSELPDVLTLYCPPGYPAEDVGLPAFHDHPFSGLSSHCLDPLLPVAAVARGCKLIEMHLQLDDTRAELDGSFSLTEQQFRDMVDDVRDTERLLG